MLWFGYRFLAILLSGASVLFLANPSATPAQVIEEGAPWRLPVGEEPDLMLQEPLDINAASLDDLENIPGLNHTLAQAILDFRDSHGRISSLELLRIVLSINDELYDIIRQYTQVVDEDNIWRCRITASLAVDGDPPEGIGGSPHQDRLKLGIKNPSSLAMGIALEKDAGEVDFWDHAAMGLEYQLPHNRGKLILGDYLLRYGFGLLTNTRRNFHFAQQFETLPDLQRSGISAYQGWSENLALRGIAIQSNLGRCSFETWISHRKRDSYLDSLGTVTAFDLSGWHRTALEQAREDACDEILYGGRIRYSLLPDRLAIAGTGYQASWNRTVRIGAQDYNRIAAGALELRIFANPLSAAFELASDEYGESASMLGILARSARAQAQCAFYRASAQYFSPLSSALDLDLGEVRNRQGALASVRLSVGRTRLLGSMHLYRRLVRAAGESWGGQDLLARIQRRFGTKIEAAMSSRWTQEEETTETPKGSHWRSSGSLRAIPSPNWEINAVLKLTKSNDAVGQGQLIQLELGRIYAPQAPWTFRGELTTGIYYAPDYDLRLYWSDMSLDGSWQSQAFWGRGAYWAMVVRAGYGELLALEIFGLWDQLESESSRLPERSLKITLRIQG